jgi:hypothetical protein
MPEPCIVLIAAPELMAALRGSFASAGHLLTFPDTEPLEALAAITKRRPQVVALEGDFAASPRGTALVGRINSDPALKETEILIVSRDGASPRVLARPRVEPGAPGAAQHLDRRGTRRVPRFRMKETIEVLLEGSPATLVDLSVLGAQLVSATVLRPNKRIRVTLRDTEAAAALRGTVVWARFEPPQAARGACYRGGVEFVSADAIALGKFCRRHTA